MGRSGEIWHPAEFLILEEIGRYGYCRYPLTENFKRLWNTGERGKANLGLLVGCAERKNRNSLKAKNCQ